MLMPGPSLMKGWGSADNHPKGGENMQLSAGAACCHADTEKARASRNLRRGKGKMRNRRYVTRKGPLVVYAEDSGLVRAFRNIPGVDTQSVESLNLLQVGGKTLNPEP